VTSPGPQAARPPGVGSGARRTGRCDGHRLAEPGPGLSPARAVRLGAQLQPRNVPKCQGQPDGNPATGAQSGPEAIRVPPDPQTMRPTRLASVIAIRRTCPWQAIPLPGATRVGTVSSSLQPAARSTCPTIRLAGSPAADREIPQISRLPPAHLPGLRVAHNRLIGAPPNADPDTGQAQIFGSASFALRPDQRARWRAVSQVPHEKYRQRDGRARQLPPVTVAVNEQG
jgi:hypothetical protein